MFSRQAEKQAGESHLFKFAAKNSLNPCENQIKLWFFNGKRRYLREENDGLTDEEEAEKTGMDASRSGTGIRLGRNAGKNTGKTRIKKERCAQERTLG
jgi:hypothetical protein